MKKLTVAMFVLVFSAIGCGSYSARQVPIDEPKDLSYCQRVDDMAVGIEPYMMKEKTNLVFGNSLQKEEVMALSVSMKADGGKDYVVRKSDIKAVDEFGNEFTPMTPAEVASRIDRAFRKDVGLQEDITGKDMPESVTVSNGITQHFLFYDMKANHAEARMFTVSIPATSKDGMSQKAFKMTVDPMRQHMNPTERWDSYDGRGVTMTCMATEEKAAPAPKVSEAPKPDDSARKAAEKQERIFEKQLMK